MFLNLFNLFYKKKIKWRNNVLKISVASLELKKILLAFPTKLHFGWVNWQMVSGFHWNKKILCSTKFTVFGKKILFVYLVSYWPIRTFTRSLNVKKRSKYVELMLAHLAETPSSFARFPSNSNADSRRLYFVPYFFIVRLDV